MSTYHGRIISAFETVRYADGSGQEVHLLEFPNEDAFAEYRLDSQLLQQADLRDKAIDSVTVILSKVLKNYR